jgi:hypothetical protein
MFAVAIQGRLYEYHGQRRVSNEMGMVRQEPVGSGSYESRNHFRRSRMNPCLPIELPQS